MKKRMLLSFAAGAAVMFVLMSCSLAANMGQLGSSARPVMVAELTAATITPTAQATETPEATTETVVLVEPTSTPVPTSQPAHTVGDTVRVGFFEYVVKEAIDKGNFLKSNNQFEKDRTTTGKYIEVIFDAKNIGSDSNAFERTGGLVDSQGRKFDQIDMSNMFVSDEHTCSITEAIQPTFVKTCAVIFEVPADSHGFTINFVDQEMFGDGLVEVFLGG
jgi:flagellar basal body L-ring protein FlgH